jgi:hypothetical protein
LFALDVVDLVAVGPEVLEKEGFYLLLSELLNCFDFGFATDCLEKGHEGINQLFFLAHF